MSDKIFLIIVVVVLIIMAVVIKRCVQKHKEHTRNNNPSVSGNDSTRSFSSASNTQSCSCEITELGPVNYYANDRHNRKDKWFQFYYKKVNGEWLTYILRMPSLNGRDGNLHITHRYHRDDKYWICYDPQPKTLKDAQTVSRAWADRELEYISTGINFENQRW